ncbi:tautomerase family protein [uncultured Desulfuromusa sp.]|nr:tautomerase family protein [uncultured Desulfuromusa sp.]
MPYINIRVGSRLNSLQKSNIQNRTTDLMNRVMGKRREVTVVHIDESVPALWAVDGKGLKEEAPVAVYVDIKVTQGTNSAEEKAQMIARTVTMLKEEIGAIQEACYVLINDIPANSWGYDGISQAERADKRLKD